MLSTDAVLVLRCQGDDSDAFDEIVARYKDGVYNYIFRMVSNREDAEDLAVEVFVRAFTGIKSFRRDSNLRTWLYRIATNLCVDRYRRTRLEKQLVVPINREHDDGERPRLAEPPDSTYDPRRVCERRELRAEVHRALSRLPDKLRATILLYEMEGLSYEEIAEILGVPLGTVKSRVFNARMHLRNLLTPYVEA